MSLSVGTNNAIKMSKHNQKTGMPSHIEQNKNTIPKASSKKTNGWGLK